MLNHSTYKLPIQCHSKLVSTEDQWHFSVLTPTLLQFVCECLINDSFVQELYLVGQINSSPYICHTVEERNMGAVSHALVQNDDIPYRLPQSKSQRVKSIQSLRRIIGCTIYESDRTGGIWEKSPAKMIIAPPRSFFWTFFSFLQVHRYCADVFSV